MHQVITDDGLATGGGEQLEPIAASRLATRLERLRNTLRPTPHVQLAIPNAPPSSVGHRANATFPALDRAWSRSCCRMSESTTSS